MFDHKRPGEPLFAQLYGGTPSRQKGRFRSLPERVAERPHEMGPLRRLLLK